MFCIQASPTYRYPVPVVVLDERGNARKHSFTAIFRRLDSDQIAELRNEAPTDIELSRRVLAGWDEVTDAKGNALTFDDANLAQLLLNAPVPRAIGNAFFRSLDTESHEVAAEKN